MEKVFINGEVYKYTHPETQKLIEVNTNILSDYVYDNNDPVIKFNSVKTLYGGETYRKTYTSLPYLREFNNVSIGEAANDVKLLIGIDWVAKGSLENSNKEEFYFVLDTKEQLDLICSNYSLTYPLPSNLSFSDFMTTEEFQLFGVTNKMWGSVVFENNEPSYLKAYLFNSENVPS